MPTPSVTSREPAPSADERFTAALEAIAQSNSALLANQPRRRLSFGDWIATQPKRVMPCVVYQNGVRLDETMLDDAALALLPKLRKGKFLNRLITVYQDTNHTEQPWHITYPCKTVEQRITLANAIRGDFTELLRRLTTDEPIID
jgi:hypothetical protein